MFKIRYETQRNLFSSWTVSRNLLLRPVSRTKTLNCKRQFIRQFQTTMIWEFCSGTLPKEPVKCCANRIKRKLLRISSRFCLRRTSNSKMPVPSYVKVRNSTKKISMPFDALRNEFIIKSNRSRKSKFIWLRLKKTRSNCWSARNVKKRLMASCVMLRRKSVSRGEFSRKPARKSNANKQSWRLSLKKFHRSKCGKENWSVNKKNFAKRNRPWKNKLNTKRVSSNESKRAFTKLSAKIRTSLYASKIYKRNMMPTNANWRKNWNSSKNWNVKKQAYEVTFAILRKNQRNFRRFSPRWHRRKEASGCNCTTSNSNWWRINRYWPDLLIRQRCARIARVSRMQLNAELNRKLRLPWRTHQISCQLSSPNHRVESSNFSQRNFSDSLKSTRVCRDISLYLAVNNWSLIRTWQQSNF